MKKIITLSMFALIIGNANAQIIVDGTQTPTQWVQGLFQGSGVIISNVTYVGAPAASGTFMDTLSSIGFGDGVLLTTGTIQNAVGPNNSTSITGSNSLPGDPDLDLIMAPQLSHDASVLEFDFIPVGDTTFFIYSFASDEYMEYANGGINDGFGFFVSGPGITGPYSNNAVNIALIPGTITPVTINNVNLINNPQYYYDNGDGIGTGTAPDGTQIQYDGYTVPLIAQIALTCGQTYHIKIAIGDGADGILDSGVFLEGYSFSSIVTTPSQLRTTDSYCPADSVYLMVAPAGFTSYQWFDAAGNFIHISQGGTNDTLRVSNPTFGSVYRLDVISPAYCGAYILDTITAAAPTNCFDLGINSIINNETITISPNPFTSQTTITFSEEHTSTSSAHTLIITDVIGNIIQQLTINTKQSTIDMSGFAKGIYFVRIEDSTKNAVNRKIIVN